MCSIHHTAIFMASYNNVYGNLIEMGVFDEFNADNVHRLFVR